MTKPAAPTFGLYGQPPAELVDVPAGALQYSPVIPGSDVLASAAAGSLSGMIVLAPPATIERRSVVAGALRAVKAGGELTILAPKDKGGSRLRKELEAFGCSVEEDARRHHRICTVARPAEVTGLDEAIAEGAPRLVEAIGLWSQPGVFSWDRIDPGSALLMEHLPQLAGRGADLGCGIGVLSRKILTSAPVASLAMVDVDRRALEAAKLNVVDSRATRIWADLRQPLPDLRGLDFVVMNPPFHDGGAEDKALGQMFVRRAAELLRRGGRCLLVANRHLPYESVLQPLFKTVTMRVETGAYKVYEAQI
ncbi:class I SAM-dependent methyltransferase [Phreatobacter aquaticus]|uniref:Class I SAM-dependent methyltransferase n=1 Tax=Phreatobacter aquaticus TaxID=2570229 RepID=A0A4D7QDZ3_9HYPH|nr:class I SAM-dependent methyltransferase [Phreatobacter aquaticus]QCK84691.1 class I SAM-dependent methyltransferase [Phreatobacter aquaticus]